MKLARQRSRMSVTATGYAAVPPRLSAVPHGRWRNPRVAGDLGDQHPDLVGVAPAPVLARLERVDQLVAARVVVGGRVPVRRVVAAADVAALQADAQVQPGVAGLQALLAAGDAFRQL